MIDTPYTDNRHLRAFALIIALWIVCAAPGAKASGPWYSQDSLLHDRMDYGEHPDLKWHSSLVGWLSYFDGYAAGLPEIDFRSAIISGIRFDETLDTVMVITRLDRNDMSKFAIGYTAVPPPESDYDLGKVAFGVYIDSTGALSPSWDAGNESLWAASLPPGIFDLRITVDRTMGGITFEFGEADSFNAPLSEFDPPAVSISETVQLADIIHIQMNFYNQYSAVYDTWSVRGTPSLLWIHHPQSIRVEEGDTIEFEAWAEYDGDKELSWSFEDDRFAFEDSLFRWITRDGDGGLYESWLSVTDGKLTDNVLISYAVTQVYDSSLTHGRMEGPGIAPYGWTYSGAAISHTGMDGYLTSAEPVSWTTSAVSRLEEPLDGPRCWVFRIAAGGGGEYAIGITKTAPEMHDGRYSNIDIGLLIEPDGRVSRAWYSAVTQFEETVLDRGIYDIRISWDPAIEEARFEAVPVASWADSLSDFSESVWTTCDDAGIDPPAWVQASVIRRECAVYDIWSYEPEDGPDLVEDYSVDAGPAVIEISWRVSSGGWSGDFVLVRCPGVPEGCRELMRIPVIEGMSSFGYHDRDVLPGSVHGYMVYLDRGLGMELLFETGAVEVPVAPAELFQNYPNPFNPVTTVSWYLPEASRVKVTIYDISGRPVRLLVDETFEGGVNSASWDGTIRSGEAAASGIYFYRIEAGPFSDSRKMILLR